MEEKNMGIIRGNTLKLSITSDKDLTIELPETGESPPHRLD